MSLEIPLTPRQEQEARLTALLLGELSPEESAALRQTLQADPELARLCASLETTLALVREAAGSGEDLRSVDPSLKLSPSRREKLLESFKIIRPAKLSRSWRISASELSGLAAMLIALLALAGLVAYPLLNEPAKSRAQRLRTITDLPAQEGDLAFMRKRVDKSLQERQASWETDSGRLRKWDDLQAPAATPVPESALGVRPSEPVAPGTAGADDARFGSTTDGDFKLGRKLNQPTPEISQVNEAAPPNGSISSPTAFPAPVLLGRGAAVPQTEAAKPLDSEARYFEENKEREANSRRLLGEGSKTWNAEPVTATGRLEAAAALHGVSTFDAVSPSTQPQTPPTLVAPSTASEQAAKPPTAPFKLGYYSFGGGGGLGGAPQPNTALSRTLERSDASNPSPAQQNHLSDSAIEDLDRNGRRELDQKQTTANVDFAPRDTAAKAFGASVGGTTVAESRLQRVDPSTGLPALEGQNSPHPTATRFNNSDPYALFAVENGRATNLMPLSFFERPKNELSKDAAKTKVDQRPALGLPPARASGLAPQAVEAKIEQTVSEEFATKTPAGPTSNTATRENDEREQLFEKRVAGPPAGAPEPQPEKLTGDEPFSTFSLNVSDVSFKLAGAALERGAMPELATVRSEEFINAFDYRDPEPTAGAPLAFAWEQTRHPFAHNRDLLRFSIKTAASGRPPGRPLNIVLLLDNSGSMERADRVRIIRECLQVLAGQLQPQDRVSVVAFARTPRLWVDGLAGSQAAELGPRVGGLTPEGGTNLEEALKLAYQTALRHYTAHGLNRVVLLTDGAANLGDTDPRSLQRQVETHRQQGIALDCFGIGWEGYNDDLLEQLARHGDGRYGFVNTPAAAATEFAGQLAGALQVAASDVKVQVEFNPRRVTAYRQIGYAKHQLAKEQFRDNTVDAAEIGAAETGTALYAIAVDPRGEGPLGTVRVRYKVPGTGEFHEHEWAVPFTGAALPLEQSSPALKLAGVAASFSEWLVSSPFAGEVTADRLLNYLRGVPELYGADPRPKRLEWMIRQAKSVSGK